MMRSINTAVLTIGLLLTVAAPVFAVGAPSWSAGTSRTVITPKEAMWMSGYASRDHGAEGTLHDLWCKVLVIQDNAGNRGVLVTLDLVGIDRSVTKRVHKRLKDKHGLGPDAICIATSHTHTGPVIGGNLNAMYFLDAHQTELVTKYATFLEDTIVADVGRALGSMVPASLHASIGETDFAVNRRENREADVPMLREKGELKGPVDHDVPVLAVYAGSQVKAIVFGYACHATTLSFYKWSGDWPGFAQIEIENKYPDANAMFFAGCGADQNPLPRRTVELAQQYGKQIAGAVVDEIEAGKQKKLGSELVTRRREITLPFANPLERDELTKQLKDKNKYVAGRARVLLEKLDETGQVVRDYPYPVQVWRLGGQIDFVMLGGEVVVDYAVRLKANAGRMTFVGGYMNDVMAYIPSERVLKEGRYEGVGAMVYYGLPSRWATGIEDAICGTVRGLIGSTEKANSTP